ncbi:MAG TPA: hypothetical protein VNO33_20065 [Kofleriaceae bacterium]|nr:hypothetical protein [Kofleriaceae bacterium]
MKQQKLLFSLIVIVGALLSMGVYRMFHESGPGGEAARTEPSAVAPAAGEDDPLGLVRAWRQLAFTARDMALWPPGELLADVPRARGDAFDDPGRKKGRSPAVEDPGDESWRLRGRVRENRVNGDRYRQPQPGQPTIVTSGRRLGVAEIRLPEETRARLPLRDQDTTLRAMVCVNPAGKPVEVRISDGTGVPEVDESVARELLTERFRPLRRDGQKVGFCERVTIVLPS